MNNEALESRVSTLEKLLLSQIEKTARLAVKEQAQERRIVELTSRLGAYEEEKGVMRRKVFEEGAWVEDAAVGGSGNMAMGGEGKQWRWITHLPPRRDRLATLPVEIIKLILQECDKGDIIRMARVAYRYLQITTPLLYIRISIDEYAAERMFCQREHNRPSARVNDELSFGSTKQVTIEGRFFDTRGPVAPVRINKDRLRWNEGEKLTTDGLTVKSSNLHRDLPLWERVLEAIDPEVVAMKGRGTGIEEPSTCNIFVSRPFWTAWTRLWLISYEGESICLDYRGKVVIEPAPKEGYFNRYQLQGWTLVPTDRVSRVTIPGVRLKEELEWYGGYEWERGNRARLLIGLKKE